MTREQQFQFIKAVLFDFRDGVEDVDDAVKTIMEASIPEDYLICQRGNTKLSSLLTAAIQVLRTYADDKSWNINGILDSNSPSFKGQEIAKIFLDDAEKILPSAKRQND